ncbi:hypothetical protein IX307_002816 [Bacteroides pyogenes]|uniref:outer membrane beta-barrel protein n=1 Tax=Bacteroides pyogenes TaxID=310300 RepID=UPI001BA80E55|nr:outer membrane beta-barrel protein [Bacteroides pyogenes]MBR8721561.1 hypothetical protein [Bacteroides pyogenes]MBR8726459.1 hypothetical protein [Bacteroides pyogenes]MBR8739798.1 hypothetical protein [Bacteroides pyogenes]MBR8755613.1 hypothetical protein [Bacteroides pyogenes]MBR8788463.1 hypothetical protein [Bacteroides pyogenes]
MKRFRFLMMAAFVVVCASISAQQVITLDQLKERKQNKQSQSQSQNQQKAQQKKQTKSHSSSDYEGFNAAILQYNAVSLKSGDSSVSYSCLSAGYLKAINMGGTPFYIEPGAILQYQFKDKFKMLSVRIPVSAIYTFPISDGINLDPYAGLYLRGNIIAKNDGEDLFSDDALIKFKRVQFGLHFGLRARFNNKFMAGIGYSIDLNEISEHSKVRSLDLTFGLVF